MVPARRSRARRARPPATGTSSATGSGPDGALPPADWQSIFGGPAWEPRRRTASGTCTVRPRAARPQLGQPRGARGLPDARCASGRTAASTASASTSRTGWPRTSTEPLPTQRRARRRCRATAATRSGTATRCTRSTPSGARSSTSTTRPARPSPRRGSTPPRAPRYASPEGLGQAFNFDLLQAPTSTPASSARSSTDNLALAAAVRLVDARGCSPTTTSSATPPATGCPSRAGARREKQGSAWLLAGGTEPELDRERGPAPGARRDAVHARAARVGLPLPGRGARPARGRRHPRRRAPGPRVLPHRGRRDRAGTDAACRCRGRARGPSFGFGAGGAAPAAAGVVRRSPPSTSQATTRLDARRSTGGRWRCGDRCRPPRRSSGSTTGRRRRAALPAARTAGRS